jgi:hypothetical protein
MRTERLVLGLWLVLVSCGRAGETGTDSGSGTDDALEGLQREVDKVHDEAMEKMQDIYNLQQELKKKIEQTKDLSAEKMLKLNQSITQLDSANDAMMKWMRAYNPLPDSADREAAREYLETEMEKIRRVREAMVEAVNNGRSQLDSARQE